MPENRVSGRTVYFDYLRVLATTAVVFVHVSSENWLNTDVSGPGWAALNFYNSIVRWGVPAFVMISGALFLGRDIPVRKIYSKYVLKMAVVYIFWSVIYAVVVPLVRSQYDPKTVFTTERLAEKIIAGPFHMWFIPMIIGLYICIPVLRQIAKSEKASVYFLAVSGTFTFVIPEIFYILNDFLPEEAKPVITEIKGVISDMNMNFVLGFAFFFIAGYVISTRELSPKLRMTFYILGAAGFVSTVLLNYAVTQKTGEPCKTYIGNFTLNVALEALGMFVWFRYNVKGRPALNGFMAKLSKYSFGAYLVHVFIRNHFSFLKFNSLSFNEWLSVPAVAFSVVIASFLISFLINRIPFLKKWIV